MTYRAPVDDILLSLRSVADFDALVASGVYEGLDADTVTAIVDEAGRFGSDVLAPLNWQGDQQGATHSSDGKVTTPSGWIDAYNKFTEGGWSALPCPEDHGGQGLPSLVAMAVGEIWNSSNMAFGVCPLLTQGAIDALSIGGSDELKAKFLPRLISGEWSGTMNLTEAQAGSDLSALKTKAVPQDDGSYLISGTKIFISYGEHDMTRNIIHFVLARLPDAPEGTRGISLFLVPKFLLDENGEPGRRNDVACTGIEKKLGIHGSPTCVMTFGEKEGAAGYLVGEENRGLKTMFIMMNAARLGVGVQGVAIAERATQRAIAYAQERKQGQSESGGGSGEMVSIAQHADVRRMLLTMRSLTQAARMICLKTAAEIDVSERGKLKDEREAAKARAALLTPVAKAFSTDVACEVASIGVQVHGGMGFVEETGAAQHYRDARILPIYEGTNGIQAIDLVTRKLPLGSGFVVNEFIDDLAATVEEVRGVNEPGFGKMGERLGDAIDALREATLFLGKSMQTDPGIALAVAGPYLRLFGITAGGVYLARGALHCLRGGSNGRNEIGLARFFAENLATAAPGLAATVSGGGPSLLEVSSDSLCA